MQLYDEAVEMAIRTGADIIPIAIEKYGNRYVVNIGKNFSCKNVCLADKKLYTSMLRDVLATLK